MHISVPNAVNLQIEKVRESRPEKHVDFLKVEIEDCYLVLMKVFLVLVIDYGHEQDSIDVIKRGLHIRTKPVKVVVHYFLEYLVEDVGTLSTFKVKEL